MKPIKKLPNNFHKRYGDKKIGSILRLLLIKEIWITLGLLGGVIVLYLLAETFIPHKHNLITTNVIEVISTPEVEVLTANISSQFVCNCGQCSRESLTVCKCKNAIEERNHIRKLIEEKMKEKEILKTIIDKYGGFKKDVSKI